MSIEIQGVSKSYGTHEVLKHVSLTVESGELFVLLGASGSGKSTLLRLIAGLLEPDSGRVILHGRDVTVLPPQQRGTGFVFQNYSLFRHMTVRQNIAFGLSIRRTNRTEQNRRVDELLQLIDLVEMGDRTPSQLSGGQQQRVALARALAYEPSVLLLDEPFGALDVKIRVQLRQSLVGIQRRLGVTTILVTHDQEEAFDIADRIGIIEQGELLELGTPDALYRSPQRLFTASFLGTANLLDARRSGESVVVNDVLLPIPSGVQYLNGHALKLLFRPEEVSLMRPDNTTSRYGLIGAGVVQAVSFAQPMIRVQISLTGEHANTPIQALLTASEVSELNLREGDQVVVSLRSYHLLPI